MGTVKSWAALAAVTAVVSAVFVSLLPTGKMKNAFSALVGVILICALISPFMQDTKIDSDLFDDYSAALEEDGDRFRKKSEETAVIVAQKGYENAVRERLIQDRLKAESVNVVCDGDFRAVKANLTFKKGIDEKKARHAVKEICENAEVNIKWVKENEE